MNIEILHEPPNDAENYWLIIKPGQDTDICYLDPQLNVDLFIVSELKSLTSAWMGHTSFDQEIEAETITLIGHEIIARTLTKWMVRSKFAKFAKSESDISDKHIA